jgi:ElaB/YqjD/DUF883 family membrane-anchored ribosome-binding protein
MPTWFSKNNEHLLNASASRRVVSPHLIILSHNFCVLAPEFLRIPRTMTLRLGTPSAGAASLQPFLQDVNISTAQKIECVRFSFGCRGESERTFLLVKISIQIKFLPRSPLTSCSLSLLYSIIMVQLKLLKIILKNLADPSKFDDPKFRQLKLDNDKIRTKIAVYPAVISYLTALGFQQTTSDENTPVLKIPADVVVDTAKMHHGFTQCTKSMELLSPLSSSQAANKRPNGEQLSEKQKARRLLEEKQRLEREEAKRVREQNVAMIKQDKYVRENDPNWTSKPSAACAKTGSSISTFRDRHGEN